MLPKSVGSMFFCRDAVTVARDLIGTTLLVGEVGASLSRPRPTRQTTPPPTAFVDRHPAMPRCSARLDGPTSTARTASTGALMWFVEPAKQAVRFSFAHFSQRTVLGSCASGEGLRMSACSVAGQAGYAKPSAFQVSTTACYWTSPRSSFTDRSIQ
jgi:hypothetical protein